MAKDTLALAPLRSRAAAALAITLTTGSAALAAPEEIEVYGDDINRAGGFAVEINQNYVFSGPSGTAQSQALTPVRLYRFTPEMSFGLTDHWEVGTLVISTVAGGKFDVHGLKSRLRYIAPRPAGNPWYWGFNLEMGWTDRHLEDKPWSVELRGIAGYEGKHWIVSLNPTVETGADSHGIEPASFELQSKIGYRINDKLVLGLESYNEFGPLRRFGFAGWPQMLYVAADIELPRGELNLGIGHGQTRSADGWTIKAVLGIPLRR